MPQTPASWVEIPEFVTLCRKIIQKYSDKFTGINPEVIVAYVCNNKSRPEKKKTLYKIDPQVEPVSFTNSKTWIITMFQDDWEKDMAHKLVMVYSILLRLDPLDPGKVKPLDYADQEEMISAFGSHWYDRSDLPNILEERIN